MFDPTEKETIIATKTATNGITGKSLAIAGTAEEMPCTMSLRKNPGATNIVTKAKK